MLTCNLKISATVLEGSPTSSYFVLYKNLKLDQHLEIFTQTFGYFFFTQCKILLCEHLATSTTFARLTTTLARLFGLCIFFEAYMHTQYKIDNLRYLTQKKMIIYGGDW